MRLIASKSTFNESSQHRGHVKPFNPAAYPRKINLGCGFDKRDGYLNVDIHSFHDPDIVRDVTNLQDLPSGYYEMILAQDILEHIPWPKIGNTLKEWNRVLMVNGKLELQVPSLMGIMDSLKSLQSENLEKQYELLRCLHGSQAYDGDFHYFSFTEPVLKDMLNRAGLKLTKLELKDGWLFQATAEKTNNAHIDPIYRIDSDGEFIRAIFKRFSSEEIPAAKIEFYCEVLSKGAMREAVYDLVVEQEEFISK